jgi:hypothetical protein
VIGPFGITFADEAIDAAVWMFLPTFVLEVVPLADALPTRTACALAVVALKRR